MMNQHKQLDERELNELVQQAVAHLAPLYRQYLETESETAQSEKLAVIIGRSVAEWEYKSGFNVEASQAIIEKLEDLFPEQADDVFFDIMAMRKTFFGLLGYLVVSNRYETVHELLGDEALAALERHGFFEMLAEQAQETEEEDDEWCDDEDEDDEDEDECDEDGCCEACECGKKGCDCCSC